MRKSLPRTAVRAIVCLTAVLAVAGCSTARQPATTPAPPIGSPAASPSAPGVALRPPLDHLHGLHLDADATVLAGTHSGLVALGADGRTTRIGEADDDFMGLTGIPGTERLFASGHPGPSSSAPNPLGLIESSDGGRTWTTKSLAGQVDFHALATDGRLLVGFDGVSGLLTSTDAGTTWTTGALLSALALAVTEAGVWAVTAEGLWHSADAARTFSVVPHAPKLALLSAAADGSLWGIDADGIAWRSHTGQTWEQHSATGSVQALLAVDYDTAYAATPQALYTLD